MSMSVMNGLETHSWCEIYCRVIGLGSRITQASVNTVIKADVTKKCRQSGLPMTETHTHFCLYL